MVWNNITFIDNATDLGATMIGVNDLTSGWLFGGLMIVLFMVSMFVFYGRVGIGSLLVGNGFFLSIVAVILVNMGVLPVWVIGITIAIAVIGLLTIFMSD